MSYRHNKGLLFVFNLIYYIKYKYFEKVGIYMEDIQQMINNIKPLFEKTMKEAKQYQDNLIKPIGSLGRLEKLAITISGITGSIQNELNKKAIIVMCADNGVYEEGVSTAPQEVTAVQTYNMLEGMTGISILSRQLNIDLKVVDIGINNT